MRLPHGSRAGQGPGGLKDTYSQSGRLAAPAPWCHWRTRASLRGRDTHVGQVCLEPQHPTPPATLGFSAQSEMQAGQQGPSQGIPPPLAGLLESSRQRCLFGHPWQVLTVATWEAREALGTHVAPLPREVGLAVAATRQVLAGAIREVGLAVAAWAGAGAG